MNKKTVLILAALLSGMLPKAQINTNAIRKVATGQSAAAYFRITVKGFTCMRETADDILERDGKHDEVYLTSFSFLVNTSGVAQPNSAVRTRTKTLGDINGRSSTEYRWMAGSATGGLGGIQSGDNLPDAEPWKNNAPSSGDLLPFVLWEGQLTEGANIAVIHPGLMEWDGPADFLTTFWHSSFIAQALRPAIGLASLPFRALGIGENTSYNETDPGVWPIPEAAQNFGDVFYKSDLSGLTNEQKKQLMVASGKPGDRPVGVNAESIYNPLQIRLNYTAASQLVQKDFGYGNGIIPVRYKDDDQYKGEYILYLAIEKITDPAQKSRINVTHLNNFDPLASYSLRNVYAADKEADILNGGTASNTLVVLNELKGLRSQRWKIKKSNQYYFTITNQYNNLNLDILNRNDANGSNIVTSRPAVNDPNETQQWSFIGYCDGSWLIRNAKTQRVVEVYNAQTSVAAPLGQMDATHTANQRWFIEKK